MPPAGSTPLADSTASVIAPDSQQPTAQAINPLHFGVFQNWTGLSWSKAVAEAGLTRKQQQILKNLVLHPHFNRSHFARARPPQLYAQAAKRCQSAENNSSSLLSALPFEKDTFTVENHQFVLHKRNIVDCAKFLFSSYTGKDFLYKARINERDGVRVFAEACDGDVWSELQARFGPDVVLLLIRLYSDATRLTRMRSNGAAGHGVYLNLLNYPLASINKKGNTLLLGLLPQLRKKDPRFAKLSKERFRRLKQLVHQECISRLLAPLEQEPVSVARGPDGENYRVLPVLGLYVGDLPELCAVGGLKDKSCPACTVKKKHFATGGPGPPRTAEEMSAAWDELSELAASGATQKELKKLRCTKQLATDIAPPVLSTTLPCDIYSVMAPFERLHAVALGLFKHMLAIIVTACAKRNSLAELNRRLAALPSFPGVNSTVVKAGLEYPLKDNLQGAHLVSLLKVMPCVFTADLVDGDLGQRISAALESMLVFVEDLIVHPHDERTLAELRMSANSMRTVWVDNIRDLSKSKLVFPKIHVPVHAEEQIRKFGNAYVTVVDALEGEHRPQLKTRYERRTNKRPKQFLEQICKDAEASDYTTAYFNRMVSMGMPDPFTADDTGADSSHPRKRLRGTGPKDWDATPLRICLTDAELDDLMPTLRSATSGARLAASGDFFDYVPQCLAPWVAKEDDLRNLFGRLVVFLAQECTSPATRWNAASLRNFISSLDVTVQRKTTCSLLDGSFVRASPSFQGEPAFDSVKILGADGQPWYGQLRCLLEVLWRVMPSPNGPNVPALKTTSVALVRWYESAARARPDTNLACLDWCRAKQYGVISIESMEHMEYIVPDPRPVLGSASTAAQRFLVNPHARVLRSAWYAQGDGADANDGEDD